MAVESSSPQTAQPRGSNTRQPPVATQRSFRLAVYADLWKSCEAIHGVSVRQSPRREIGTTQTAGQHPTGDSTVDLDVRFSTNMAVGMISRASLFREERSSALWLIDAELPNDVLPEASKFRDGR